jgi:chromosome segregation ATPase
MKKSNGKRAPEAHVQAAERQLTEAKAAVAKNREEAGTRSARFHELRRKLGADPDSPGADKLSSEMLRMQARCAHLDAEAPALAKQVAAAEAALILAKRVEAESEISDLGRRLDGLSAGITRGLEQVAVLIGEHEQISIEMAALARAHELPGPAKHRWLLPAKLIRSSGGEALRLALDRSRALGVGKDAPLQPRP